MTIRTGKAPRAPAPRRGSVEAVAVCIALAVAAGAALSRAEPPRATAAGLQPRPNVVVIETDDQTVESMKVMSAVQSRIAEKGVTFKNSFVNFSKCCPSRATFLTGQYAQNHHVLGNVPPLGGFAKFERLHAHDNLAVWLQDAGYRTALIGKYLNGYLNHPIVPPGWSEWDGGLGGAVYDYDINHNGKIVHYGTAARDFKQDVLTGKALRFVDASAKGRKPFFLWLTYSAPHTNPPDPNPQPPSDCDEAAKPAPRDADAFASEPLPMPPSFNEADVSDKPKAVRSLPPLSGPEIQDVTRKYRCALESLLSVDQGVGRIIDALKARGVLGKTYVIYTSDNGYLNGEHRLPEGKIKPYEESIRVPLVIRGPGIPQGRTAQDLAINADLAPTITQVAGAKPALEMDGESLLPAADHPRKERGRELLIEAADFHGIRTQRYVYVEYKTGERELYDLDQDPYELQNVADDPGYDRVRARLALRLEKLDQCKGESCRLRPQVGLRLSYLTPRPSSRPCARNPIRARVVGVGLGGVVTTDFYLDGRLLGTDGSPPFEWVMPEIHGHASVGIRVSMLDGRRMTITRQVRACR
jgi:N-acetylglucosamine-6-sulfatase